MPFMYTTEYCLGRRGRISRSYTGIQALIAIGFDLVLGFSFAIVGIGLWLIRNFGLTACRLVAALFSLPCRAIRAVVQYAGGRVAKPAWTAFDEL